MRTRSKNLRAALPALLAVGAIAAFVTGCGAGNSRPPTSTSSSATSSGKSSAPAASSISKSQGITQHDGGDHDTDNNGGPSDGDGNL